jgi:hypothetical protein
VSPGASELNCTPRAAWAATATPTPPSGLFGIPDNQLQPQYAIDGNPATRYSSGATKAAGYFLQVDLGKANLISGITVDVATEVNDVANGYLVSLSSDGLTFTPVAYCAAVASPFEVINFKPTFARYVRYTNLGPPPPGSTAWLTIHEVGIICH